MDVLTWLVNEGVDEIDAELFPTIDIGERFHQKRDNKFAILVCESHENSLRTRLQNLRYIWVYNNSNSPVFQTAIAHCLYLRY